MPALSDRPADYKPLSQFWTPRYWPTWVGLGLMWAFAQLPYGLQIRSGEFIGWLGYHLARPRRHVCEVNLRMCFPELSEEQHRQLVRRTFRANGIGFVEIAIAWFGRQERYRDMVEIHGAEHIEKALQQGRGVLMLGLHLTCFEITGFLYSMFGDINVTYRANDKNPLMEAVMFNSRRRLYKGVYERKNIRGAMRCLKQNRVLWYAPDQDYGAQHSVFVPFFGNLAATITAGSRFANFNQSPVLFFSHYRKADNSGYELFFSEQIEEYPSGDDIEDGRIINRLVEDAIRRQPDQYLWLHKRFKTSPPGENRQPYRRDGHD